MSCQIRFGHSARVAEKKQTGKKRLTGSLDGGIRIRQFLNLTVIAVGAQVVKRMSLVKQANKFRFSKRVLAIIGIVNPICFRVLQEF